MTADSDGRPELVATRRSAGNKVFSVDIVVVYQPRYRFGHEADFVPPITGIHLAAITPPAYQVRVIHQQVEPVDLDTDADLIALSFFTGFGTCHDQAGVPGSTETSELGSGDRRPRNVVDVNLLIYAVNQDSPDHTGPKLNCRLVCSAPGFLGRRAIKIRIVRLPIDFMMLSTKPARIR